ncbi:MAG: hypothetical protein JSV35_00370, partial [Candidatus Bathyarchaeota archaeon]
IDMLGFEQVYYEYNAFGEITFVWGAFPANSLNFMSMEYESEIGLYLNEGRAYDPAIGRFLSPDVTPHSPFENQYTLNDNNPTTTKQDESAIYASMPVLKVSASGTSTEAPYCSHIPFLDVTQPSGEVVTTSEGNILSVTAYLPLVDTETLSIVIDGIDILKIQCDSFFDVTQGPYDLDPDVWIESFFDVSYDWPAGWTGPDSFFDLYYAPGIDFPAESFFDVCWKPYITGGRPGPFINALYYAPGIDFPAESFFDVYCTPGFDYPTMDAHGGEIDVEGGPAYWLAGRDAGSWSIGSPGIDFPAESFFDVSMAIPSRTVRTVTVGGSPSLDSSVAGTLMHDLGHNIRFGFSELGPLGVFIRESALSTGMKSIFASDMRVTDSDVLKLFNSESSIARGFVDYYSPTLPWLTLPWILTASSDNIRIPSLATFDMVRLEVMVTQDVASNDITDVTVTQFTASMGMHSGDDVILISSGGARFFPGRPISASTTPFEVGGEYGEFYTYLNHITRLRRTRGYWSQFSPTLPLPYPRGSYYAKNLYGLPLPRRNFHALEWRILGEGPYSPPGSFDLGLNYVENLVWGRTDAF